VKKKWNYVSVKGALEIPLLCCVENRSKAHVWTIKSWKMKKDKSLFFYLKNQVPSKDEYKKLFFFQTLLSKRGFVFDKDTAFMLFKRLWNLEREIFPILWWEHCKRKEIPMSFFDQIIWHLDGKEKLFSIFFSKNDLNIFF